MSNPKRLAFFFVRKGSTALVPFYFCSENVDLRHTHT